MSEPTSQGILKTIGYREFCDGLDAPCGEPGRKMKAYNRETKFTRDCEGRIVGSFANQFLRLLQPRH